MKNIAIKGHSTRGEEVIEILEMLGGINTHNLYGDENYAYYTIDSDKEIKASIYVFGDEELLSLTIEEFLEKFPYKVGDKVRTIYGKIGIIRKPIWSNRDECIRYELEADTDSFYFVNELQPYKEETMEEQKAIPPYMDYDVRTEKDMEEKLLNAETYFKIWNKTDNGYEECCKVLFPNSIAMGKVLTSGYNCELLKKFGELLICRDTYWKIIGEQMGLGEPWKPVYTDDNIKYSITTHKNRLDFNGTLERNYVLIFPTKEIRNAFYENFKELIEQCKELL